MKKWMAAMMCLVVAGIAVCAAPASAEDKKLGDMTLNDLKSALGMSVYLQAGYTYNKDASTGEVNDLRWFDAKANSFSLDLAELVFQKEPETGTAGYKIKIAAGQTAQMIHAAGLGTQPTGTVNPESFDITEAYISYVAPVGKGLRFDIGKMGTFIGAEVMEARDNPNYSRSFLFANAEPLTHTGLKISYPVVDALSVAVLVLNGWDNAVDNNKGKTYGASIGITPADMISLSVNVIQGPEQDNNNHDMRSLTDVVATIKPVKPLTFILNYDSGKEEYQTIDMKWSGISGIVKYDLNDTYSLSVRGETFDDKDRNGHKLKEVTVTPEIRLDGGLIVRPEYRHDMSDQMEFADGTKKTQNTIALGVMYTW
jgi:hypothetical protein